MSKRSIVMGQIQHLRFTLSPIYMLLSLIVLLRARQVEQLMSWALQLVLEHTVLMVQQEHIQPTHRLAITEVQLHSPDHIRKYYIVYYHGLLIFI